MIVQREQVTEKAILIGLILSFLIFVLTVKTNNVNNINLSGNIGLPMEAINILKRLLGH